MSLRTTFEKSRDFSWANNLFYQLDFPGTGSFEKQYINLRRKENRIYPDEVLVKLPEISADHPLRAEWRIRDNSARKLLKHLQKKPTGKILEVGCGNGWLCHHLAQLPACEVAGMDVNENELLQAARVFSGISNLTFCKADIFKTVPFDRVDCIVLAASIQYFADVPSLLNRLLNLLADEGEIHILDSPFYDDCRIPSARNSSNAYFRGRGFPMMRKYYYHHSWKSIVPFNPGILYDPRDRLNKLRQKLMSASPFPWIVIKC